MTDAKHMECPHEDPVMDPTFGCRDCAIDAGRYHPNAPIPQSAVELGEWLDGKDADITELTAQRDELLRLAKETEWTVIPEIEGWGCLECWEFMEDGHAANCLLAAAIARAEQKP